MRPSHRWLAPLGVALVVAITGGCIAILLGSSARSAVVGGPVEVGMTVPVLEFADADGRPARLEHGRVNVLIFAESPGCPADAACLDRASRLSDIYRGDRRVAFFAVGPSSTKAMPGLTTLADPSRKAADTLGVDRSLTALVINEDGVLCYRGPLDDSVDPAAVKRQYLADALRSVLRGQTTLAQVAR